MTVHGENGTVPDPSLKYGYWGDNRPDPTGIRAEGPPLYAVHEVSAWRGRAGIMVFVRGSMRCKDGHRGPNRAVQVDLTAEQPAWLAAVIADARRRLSEEATDGR